MDVFVPGRLCILGNAVSAGHACMMNRGRYLQEMTCGSIEYLDVIEDG